MNSLIRLHPHADVGDDAVLERQALIDSIGMIPHGSGTTRSPATTEAKPLHKNQIQRLLAL